jgi:MFS-type transporter involved in bile tolerance (Atg22 family)
MPEAVKYLVAYLLYNDGIQTVIAVAAIFAAQELDMSATNRILVILMIQFVAFGGAYLFGWLAGKIGAKNAILISLVIWSAAVIFAYFGMRSFRVMNVAGMDMTQAEFEFWILAFVVAPPLPTRTRATTTARCSSFATTCWRQPAWRRPISTSCATPRPASRPCSSTSSRM